MTITRDDLARFVGYAPPRQPPVTQRRVATGDGRVTETLTLAVGNETVPATYVRPEGEGPFPAVLYCHAHGGEWSIGMAEMMAGRPAIPTPLGPDFVRAGLAALCVEMPCFGARAAPGENERAKTLLYHGRTLFAQMLNELGAGLAFLRARAEIDAGHIATFGLSMGATHAFWMAALEPGVNRAAHWCCYADLGTLIGEGVIDRHGLYMVVPGLLERTSTGEIAGLIAPRPQLIGVGYGDFFTSRPAVAKAFAETRAAYGAAGSAEALTLMADDAAGHHETPALRRGLLDFLAAMRT
jgi:pimeloyl-ACP methyl ester carboxylesterase